jgi:hypothetical protein
MAGLPVRYFENFVALHQSNLDIQIATLVENQSGNYLVELFTFCEIPIG